MGGVLTALGGLGGYALISVPDFAGASYPLGKTVEVAPGAWLQNYRDMPLTMLVPALGLVGMAIAAFGFRIRRNVLTFLGTSAGIVGIIATAGVSMFPFILPSTIEPSHSLMVFDASSSQATLRNMLIATVIFLPLILLYTSWAYKVMFGRVSVDSIKSADHAY